MSDTKDVAKFNNLSDKWWDPKGPIRTLHEINPARLKFITANQSLKNQSILDVGCGGGLLTESLAKAGAKMTGIDLATDSIQVAKEHSLNENLNIDYQAICIEEFQKKQSSKFDAIVCMELLEHLEDPESFIETMVKVLKPGGKLFLSTVNRNMKSYLYAIMAAEYILKLLPKGTHDYHQFIKPSEMIKVMNRMNFECTAMQGIEYNPLLNSAKLTDDLTVNYIACFQTR